MRAENKMFITERNQRDLRKLNLWLFTISLRSRGRSYKQIPEGKQEIQFREENFILPFSGKKVESRRFLSILS